MKIVALEACEDGWSIAPGDSTLNFRGMVRIPAPSANGVKAETHQKRTKLRGLFNGKLLATGPNSGQVVASKYTATPARSKRGIRARPNWRANCRSG
jgi:hypothetical protein